MFLKAVVHGKKKTVRDGCRTTAANGREITGDGRLLLPSALLVTVQAQLLAPFMFVDFCLTAFFQ
jgi:hypothetical protein